MFARLCQTSIILSIVFSALLATSHATKIYHWVDEDGRSHYSETPPRETQAETLNIRAAGRGSAASASSSSAPVKKKAKEEKPVEEESLTAEHSPEDKAKYCQQSRALLQQMAGNTQRRFEQPDGSYRKLNEAEIADYKAQAQTGITSYCN